MMEDPAFQAQMKKMTETQAFKDHMTASNEMLKDPEKVKEMESKMQAKVKEGQDMLEKARKAREEANAKKGDGENEEDGEDDKKEADEMPDIPSLNLN